MHVHFWQLGPSVFQRKHIRSPGLALGMQVWGYCMSFNAEYHNGRITLVLRIDTTRG